MANRVKSNLMNFFFVLASIVAAFLGIAPKAEATLVNSFDDFVPESFVNTVETATPDGNLQIRDPVTGADSYVGPESWHMGFINYIDGEGAKVVGYADNIWANQGYPIEWESFMTGHYVGEEHDGQGGYNTVLTNGDKPEDVWLVRDQLGDGMGNVDGNGQWTLGADDTFYTSADIEFNGIQGDVSQLPAYEPSTNALILPNMVVNPVPEPRSDPSGLSDLEMVANYWLSNNCSPELNSDCEGADWDFDGDVDLEDFAYLANHWLE